MAYAVDEKISEKYFVELLTEKAKIIKNHLRNKVHLLYVQI